jgi:predicted nucleic acid-binding protein
MPEQRFLYWDADVFISYLNNDPGRMHTLDTILETIESSKTERIVTSVVSKVEVAWVAHEKLNRVLSPDEEKRIDDLWGDANIFEMVDFNDEIALKARSLMRDGMENKRCHTPGIGTLDRRL